MVSLATPSVAWAQEDEEFADDETEATVSVERIRPEDLPKPEESTFPSVLRQTDALPRPSSLEELRKGALEVAPRVVRVVTVQVPKPPIRPTPMLTEGHAVWVSAEDGGVRPVLLTLHSWLVDAKSIWVSPAGEKKQEGSLPRAKRASLTEMSDSRSAEKFVRKAKREGWTRVVPSKVDKHRNLTMLVADEDHQLDAPESGLRLFDTSSKPTTRVYGFSPAVGSALVATQYVEPTGELELSYYLQTTFPAVLGAPIVTDGGELVGITVFRHPEEPGRTLVVPPLSLDRYVTGAQGLRDAGGPKRDELESE